MPSARKRNPKRTGNSVPKLRIDRVDEAPFDFLAYTEVTLERSRKTARLPFFGGQVKWLPDSTEMLILTSDLQGRVVTSESKASELLGQAVAAYVEEMGQVGHCPPAAQTGAILAGDFHCRPELDRRGGSGDVRPVWAAFASRYRWVAGVAGNHDVFGAHPSVPDFQEFLRTPGVCFLDTAVSDCGGLRIGGVSGIIGNPRRPFRKEEQAYLESVEMVLEQSPDLLILHDGPDYPGLELQGIRSLRTLLEAHAPLLVVRGHKHWSIPLVELSNGTQVLNVDSRVVLLTQAPHHADPDFRK